MQGACVLEPYMVLGVAQALNSSALYGAQLAHFAVDESAMFDSISSADLSPTTFALLGEIRRKCVCVWFVLNYCCGHTIATQ